MFVLNRIRDFPAIQQNRGNLFRFSPEVYDNRLLFPDGKRYFRCACDGLFARFRDGEKEVVTNPLEMFFLN